MCLLYHKYRGFWVGLSWLLAESCKFFCGIFVGAYGFGMVAFGNL